MGGPVRRIIDRPKVQQAIVAPKPMTAPKGPTKAETPQYDQSKRRGRRATILTSTSGVSQDLELAKKTLLGG